MSESPANLLPTLALNNCLNTEHFNNRHNKWTFLVWHVATAMVSYSNHRPHRVSFVTWAWWNKLASKTRYTQLYSRLSQILPCSPASSPPLPQIIAPRLSLHRLLSKRGSASSAYLQIRSLQSTIHVLFPRIWQISLLQTGHVFHTSRDDTSQGMEEVRNNKTPPLVSAPVLQVTESAPERSPKCCPESFIADSWSTSLLCHF